MTPRVNAIIAGAQKSGTTALHQFLIAHPGIAGGRNKEIHFFDNDPHFVSGFSYDSYHRQFANAPATSVWLDATPIYLYWAACAERIAVYNPQMRLIVLLRDPVERAYSQWQMEYARGSETESFERAIESEDTQRQADPAFQHRVRSYLARGEYATQLARFDRLFPKDQISLVRYEEFRAHPEVVVERLCDFLSVEPFERLPVFREVLPNVPRQALPAMNTTTRLRLRAYFAPHNTALEARTGWDLTVWSDGAR